MAQTQPKPDEKLYTIGTVAQLTGVAPITLRAWERRYDLIQPVRKDSGHRLYTRRHIDQINRITALTTRGMRISQIRPEMLETELDGDTGDAPDRDEWSGRIDSMIAAIIAFDEVRLEEIYNEALALYPIGRVTSHLLKPLLVTLGKRWESTEGLVSEEHFFAFYLRNKLGSRFHHRNQRTSGPLLLVAGLPNEYHEIALLIFALAAHEQGYRLLPLGANTPLDELPYVVEKARCDAIVLSGAILPEPSVLEQLPHLVREVAVPVLVGGQSSVMACDAINASGAEALGTDIERGLRRLDELLHPIE